MNVYRFLLKHMYLIRFYFVFIPFWTKKVFENVHTFFWVIIYMKNVYKQALDLVDEQIIAEKGSSMYLYNMFKLIVVCYIFVAFLFFCKAAGDSKAKWNAWNFPFFHFLCQLLSVPLLNVIWREWTWLKGSWMFRYLLRNFFVRSDIFIWATASILCDKFHKVYTFWLKVKTLSSFTIMWCFVWKILGHPNNRVKKINLVI